MRRACSDMMLQLPHLLQAGQAEIPIQFVDEIPHDRIPVWQRMEEKASEGRKDLRQKVDALRAEMTTMGTQLATAMKDTLI